MSANLAIIPRRVTPLGCREFIPLA